MEFCADTLMRAGYQTEFSGKDFNANTTHIDAYKYLRSQLFQYYQAGGQLNILQIPRGGRKWIELQKEIEEYRDGGFQFEGVQEFECSEEEVEEVDTDKEDADYDGILFNP